MTLTQLLCGLLGRHVFVRRASAGRLQERCFVCDRPKGAGWDFADLVQRRERQAAKPVRAARKPGRVLPRWIA